jgi:uncharacterized protein (DUF427 family)
VSYPSRHFQEQRGSFKGSVKSQLEVAATSACAFYWVSQKCDRVSAALLVAEDAQTGSTMARAIWNGRVVAESETTETVEGNVYFPETSLKREYFRSSSTTSTCPWKGQARYMSLLIDGQDNPDAAWYYPDPKPAARKIKGFVAFWRGVEVEK